MKNLLMKTIVVTSLLSTSLLSANMLNGLNKTIKESASIIKKNTLTEEEKIARQNKSIEKFRKENQLYKEKIMYRKNEIYRDTIDSIRNIENNLNKENLLNDKIINQFRIILSNIREMLEMKNIENRKNEHLLFWYKYMKQGGNEHNGINFDNVDEKYRNYVSTLTKEEAEEKRKQNEIDYRNNKELIKLTKQLEKIMPNLDNKKD